MTTDDRFACNNGNVSINRTLIEKCLNTCYGRWGEVERCVEWRGRRNASIEFLTVIEQISKIIIRHNESIIESLISMLVSDSIFNWFFPPADEPKWRKMNKKTTLKSSALANGQSGIHTQNPLRKLILAKASQFIHSATGYPIQKSKSLWKLCQRRPPRYERMTSLD